MDSSLIDVWDVSGTRVVALVVALVVAADAAAVAAGPFHTT